MSGWGMDEEKPAIEEAELVDDSPAAIEVSAGKVSAATALPTAPEGDYTEAGVPNFDYVRERIEGRVATSIGAAELSGDTSQAKSVDEQMAERDRAGRERLEQIRRSLGEGG
jgi:phage shock protein A